MFTLVAYRSEDVEGGTWQYVTPVADQHVRVEAYNIIVPPDMANLAGVAIMGRSIAAGRVETPSLRRTTLYEVVPVVPDVEVQNGLYMVDLFYNPIALDPSEPMRVVAFNAPTTTDDVEGFVWLSDGPQTPVGGAIHTVACEDVTIAGTGVWESYALTFSQTLPAGVYQCVGGHVASQSLLAWRLIFVGQAWRPGGFGVASVYSYNNPIFRRGALGVWGEFTHDQPPVLEVLALGGGPCHIYLDLVKVS